MPKPRLQECNRKRMKHSPHSPWNRVLLALITYGDGLLAPIQSSTFSAVYLVRHFLRNRARQWSSSVMKTSDTWRGLNRAQPRLWNLRIVEDYRHLSQLGGAIAIVPWLSTYCASRDDNMVTCTSRISLVTPQTLLPFPREFSNYRYLQWGYSTIVMMSFMYGTVPSAQGGEWRWRLSAHLPVDFWF